MKISRLLRRLRRFASLSRGYSPNFLAADPDYQDHEIGEFTYGAPLVKSWEDGTTLKIGRFCSFAPGATILLGGEHRVDWVTTYPFSTLFPDAAEFSGHPASKGDVLIGNDVWIGTDVMILSGVTIGDGAVIAARSLVTKDIAAYAIAAGSPAKTLRYRFSEDVIRSLESIAWWNWPLEKIKEAWPLLLSEDIGAFVTKYGTAQDDREL